MAKASLSKELDIDRATFLKVVQDFENYPKFVDGMKKSKILKKEGIKTRVQYDISMMKDVQYVLDHECDEAAGLLKWWLVQSDFFNKNDGSWEVKELGPKKIHVTYSLDVDFKIPVPKGTCRSYVGLVEYGTRAPEPSRCGSNRRAQARVLRCRAEEPVPSLP